MVDRKNFYDKVRKEFFNGKLSQSQVEGMEAILNKWDSSRFTDLRWLAYMLGTVYHETAKTMYPIEEYGKGKGRPYGSKIMHSGQTYFSPDKIYYGRGFIQLTWYENYNLMGKLLKLPLLENPELLLNIKVATDVMFEGMTKGLSGKGDFTGVSLEKYFNSTTEDWVSARKIINGLDRADIIAAYGKRFLKCLV